MAKKKELLVVIKDEEDWVRNIAESDKLCLVIDCHQEWSGPCECIEPTFRKMWLDTEDCDNRLRFLAANLKVLGHKVKSLLPNDSPVKLDTNGCMPFFLVVRYKQVVGTVVGVNTPQIQQLVSMHLPELKREEAN